MLMSPPLYCKGRTGATHPTSTILDKGSKPTVIIQADKNFIEVDCSNANCPQIKNVTFDGMTKEDFDGRMLSSCYRIDCAKDSAFWVEIYGIETLKSDKPPEPTEPDKPERKKKKKSPMLEWSPIYPENAVLTLWPQTIVTVDDTSSLLDFFKRAFDIVPEVVGCVETLPDKDEYGQDVPDTGGRVDFFFYVKMADVPKFAFERFKFSMRWWEDVYFNNGQDIYPSDFLKAFPNAV